MNAPLLVNTADLQEQMTPIPGNYKRSTVMKVETDYKTDPMEIYNRVKRITPTQVWRFSANLKVYRSSKPISVKVYSDGDLFFAENETLAVCGTGDTQHDALQDWALHIVHFYEYYKQLDESQLIGEALRLKELYKSLLVEE